MAKKTVSFGRLAAGVGFALALAAIGGMVLAPALWAAGGYLVNDQKKVCHFLEQPPGVGLGGYRWAEQCPEGYEVLPLPAPEKPWYVKLLDALDRWFGLKQKVIWLPTAGQVALVGSIVLLLRRLLQVLQHPLIDRLTHGLGTIIISAIVSVLTVVQPMLEDQALSLYELLLALASTVALSSGFWELLKSLVGPSAVESERLKKWLSALRRLLGL